MYVCMCIYIYSIYIIYMYIYLIHIRHECMHTREMLMSAGKHPAGVCVCMCVFSHKQYGDYAAMTCCDKHYQAVSRYSFSQNLHHFNIQRIKLMIQLMILLILRFVNPLFHIYIYIYIYTEYIYIHLVYLIQSTGKAELRAAAAGAERRK